MSARRVTLGDVAQQAAVSVATVSRALSGDPQISEATQARVRLVAESLHYVPNVAARSLVLQSSTTFGLMTPDVTDPIHGQIVTGFQQRAAERGYTVILANGLMDPDNERRALREFASHRVAGVAVMGSVLAQSEVTRLMAPSPALFIGTDHLPPRGGALDLSRGCLRPDDLDGMRQIVAHLAAQRYRRVAYVSGTAGANQIIRREALVQALAEHRRVAPIVYEASGYVAAELAGVAASIRADRPDVAVCYDDKTALNLIDALRTVGLTVPVDIGVVGFDDMPFAGIANPRLTTVAQPSEEMGRTSVDHLMAALEDRRLPKSRLMPVTLVVRESTPGPPAQHRGVRTT